MYQLEELVINILNLDTPSFNKEPLFMSKMTIL